MTGLLVTGGAGFIGSAFVRHWRRGHPQDRIVVLDALTYAGGVDNLAGIAEIEFVRGNIRDRAGVERLLVDRRLDTIVHFAAETHVDRSIAAPDAFVSTNVLGTHALLEAARRAWLDTGSGRAHRFHHVSTDEVYGSLALQAPPSREEDAYRPSSPYAASKAASDHLVDAYARTYGLQVTISRCSNNYGARQFPEKLIPHFVISALRGRQLPIYGDGLQRRDWLHVDDHCRGIATAIEKGQPGQSYNLGGDAERANREVVQALCDAIDRRFEGDRSLASRFPESPAARGQVTAVLMSNVADRKGHDRRYALDSGKSRRQLDYHVAEKFDDGIAETVDWYVDNESWWRQRLARA